MKEHPRAGTKSLGMAPETHGHNYAELALHSHHASAAMTHAVKGFNNKMEKLAELAVVLLVGAMLPYAVPWPALWWFLPALFIAVRSLAVYAGTSDKPMAGHQRAMISWFGIRGIGSVFYLMFVISHGVDGVLAQQLITLTLMTVAMSIVVHGISVRPMMTWYLRRKPAST